MNQERIFINGEVNSIVCLNFQISVFIFDFLELLYNFGYFHNILFSFVITLPINSMHNPVIANGIILTSKSPNDFVASPKKQVSHKTNVTSSQVTTFKIVLFSFFISL